jgi:hypothetical protein
MVFTKKGNGFALGKTMKYKREKSKQSTTSPSLCQDTHQNFACSEVPILLPKQARYFEENDRNRLLNILTTGQLPVIRWKLIQTQFELRLSQLLRRSIKVNFLDIKSSPGTTPGTTPVDLDSCMENTKTDCVVIHDAHFVYVCTFSRTVCNELYCFAKTELGIFPEVTTEVINGIALVGNTDTMQVSEAAVYTANLGATVRPQPSTAFSKSKSVLAVDLAIGSHRGSQVDNLHPFPYCLPSAVTLLYQQKFFSVFQNKNLPSSDCWYGSRANKKGSRRPRFSAGYKFSSRSYFKIPAPLKASIPPTSNLTRVSLARFENQVRTLSEWILCNLFYPLPYGTAASIAAKQLTNACKKADSLGNRLPCRDLCRPLPKGAIGLQKTKDLHDDGNSAVIPGIWTSVRGDDNVIFRFIGSDFNVFFRCSTNRFCWFVGWVPHKTEVLNQPAHRSLGKMINVERIHHSGFSYIILYLKCNK